MDRFVALLKKDIFNETRGGETVILLVVLSTVMTAIIAVGVELAILRNAEVLLLYPSVVWLVCFVASTIALERSFDAELHDRAIDGLVISGAPFSMIYLSKVVTTGVITLLGHIGSAVLLSVLLNVDLFSVMIDFFWISCLTVSALSSLMTLLMSISSRSVVRSGVLTVVALPLAVPLFFAAINLTQELFRTGSFTIDSFWFSLLAALNVLYLVLGINLFEFTCRG